MSLYYQAPRDPTADSGHGDDLASCFASQLLERELQQYCDAELSGRSMLVAGLRGAGKTWLVEGTLKRLIRRSRQGPSPKRRPLVVRLTGPQIFDVLNDEPEEDAADKPSSAADGGAHAESSVIVNTPCGARHWSPLAPTIAAQKRKRKLQKRLFRNLLELVTLGLQAALAQELVFCLREQASTANGADFHELAAALEITLPEGPSPSVMREFWRQATGLNIGVLFTDRRVQGAGMKELAALSGIGYAYKRVAGRLVKSSVEKSNASTTTSSVEATPAAARESRLAEVIKPFASLLAGTTVTAAAAAPDNMLNAVLLGVAMSVFSTLLFRFSTSSTRKDEDSRDETFIPNTDADTLERVLPQLLERMHQAGLAPVIIIDELDKVDDLWKLLEGYELLDQFKKLFAERVFTCLLVNRDFMEQLRLKSDAQPYGRFHSYFTLRTYVSFEPAELHEYLERLIVPVHG